LPDSGSPTGRREAARLAASRVRALLACGALAILFAVAGCGGSSHRDSTPSASARPPLEAIFEPGLPNHGDPSTTLDVMRRLGVSRIKLYIPWTAVAPDPAATRAPSGFHAADPAAYAASAWAPYDTVLRDARARGVDVDLTVGAPPPAWAAGPGAPGGGGSHPQWRPSAQDFGDFMRAVGTRYDGRYTPPGSGSPLPRVDFWAIWNEPNYGPDLAPQAIDHSRVEVSPRLYRGLLDAAWSALQATGHGRDTVLIGELAPRGQTVGDQPGNFSGMVPLRFVRALYCVGANLKPLSGTAATERGCPPTAAASRGFPAAHPILFHAGGFSDHPYPQGRQPPNAVTPFEPDYADLAALPKLERLLDDVQAAYGSSTRFPIYSTEFGYITDPPQHITRAAPLATAAFYLNWSEYLSWRDPRIRSYDQYLLVDPPPTGTSGFDSGLEFSDGTPKPTFDAYRLPLFLPVTRAAKRTSLEIWGCVRPAAYAQRDTGRRQVAVLEFARAPGQPFSVLARVPIVDVGGYFDVHETPPGSGVVRLSWTYPHGPTVHSRVVSVTIG
jgi:hypothetical protein